MLTTRVILFIVAVLAGIGWGYVWYLRQYIQRILRPFRGKKIDATAVFAVVDSEPWWIAVHDAITELEAETIEGARRYVANTNQCISAIGAGEGVALVRTRLIEKRDLALRELKRQPQPQQAA